MRRQGVECILGDDDAGPTPIRESRALGIQARTLEAFQRLGVADAFAVDPAFLAEMG